MKRTSAALLLLCVLVAGAQAIGMQHGLFRSQSTQGDAWQGTATIVEESYDITVYPDYLDVELTWVLEAGGTAPAEHADALEIVGNINLVDKSVVVGMITWWQGQILKGKLKTQELAREAYEDVVDRDADRPQPPRDPVLLEWIRDDNYDISVFPVAFGGTRKVRFRYLIPAFTVDGVNKIDYPHAFTENATVSMRKGAGVQRYSVELVEPGDYWYENDDFLPLDPSAYEFEAYGGSRENRIMYVIPELKRNDPGSRFYAGRFSTASFSGQMLHVATMTGEEALARTPFDEDFVILWRWNHPQVLEKYARQIVEQCGLLEAFLEQLDEANERVALIIDKEGGERIAFSLDSKGGPEYTRMLAYLAELEQQAVVDPPTRETPRSGDIDFDVDQAVEEFRAALAAAMAMFDDNAASLRHLLILTAGPKLVSTVVTDTSLTVDPAVNVSLLHSYLQSSSDHPDLGSAGEPYWPGVNLEQFVMTHGAGLHVTATVGNGVDSSTIDVTTPDAGGTAYCLETGTTQMHLYSSRPVRELVQWRVYRDDDLLAEYREKPLVVRMDDGMQYARLIGSSVHLVPLSSTMPSSMAATLGFIDEEYALVALEEDALSAAEAARYESGGVPLLDPADIYASADEVPNMPVEEWLTLNPPEPMSESRCWYSWGIRGVDGIFVAIAVADMVVFEDAMAPEAGRIAPPMAPVIYPEDAELYVDWESALLSVEPPAVAAVTVTAPLVRTHNGSIVLNLSAYGPADLAASTLTITDLSGRVVLQLRGAELARGRTVALKLSEYGLSRGAYTLVLHGPGIREHHRVVVR